MNATRARCETCDADATYIDLDGDPICEPCARKQSGRDAGLTDAGCQALRAAIGILEDAGLDRQDIHHLVDGVSPYIELMPIDLLPPVRDWRTERFEDDSRFERIEAAA